MGEPETTGTPEATQEGDSLRAVASAASDLELVISYEEIS